MRRVVMVAAAVLTAATVWATTFTNVQVHSLVAGSDTYKIWIYNGANGTGSVVGSTVRSGTAISGYYSSGCNCYEVPLTLISWAPGYTQADAVSSRVLHYSPNIPNGQESMIEILD